MLPKKKRLSREEFNRFFSIGKKKHTPNLFVVYSPHPTFHASVVVSKKVGRTAVKRNKIRRQIYDIVRNLQKNKSFTGVYIFVTKPEILKATHEKVKNLVEKTVEQIQK